MKSVITSPLTRYFQLKSTATAICFPGCSDGSTLSTLRSTLWSSSEFPLLFTSVVSAPAPPSHARATRDSDADADAKYPTELRPPVAAATATATTAAATATAIARRRSVASVSRKASRGRRGSVAPVQR